MSSRNIPLPLPAQEYNQQLEGEFRRQLEIALLRINDTIDSNNVQSNKDSSLALRRHQFLLMGAS
jgi:hypothetical protein